MIIGFFKDLWNNVFTPGSSPAVVKATHISFVGLTLTILAMLFLTRSVHFVFLLLLTIALWVTTAWFINEYNVFLKEQELKKQEEEKTHTDHKEDPEMIEKVAVTNTSTEHGTAQKRE